MWQNFEKIDYNSLNAKQKESFNFQKIAAAFADYGFSCIQLTDDWNGADFLANHVNGRTLLRVQLKGRLTFATKYLGKDLWICFPMGESVYCYPHDEGLHELRVLMMEANDTDFTAAENWKKNETAVWAQPTKLQQAWLDENYKLK